MCNDSDYFLIKEPLVRNPLWTVQGGPNVLGLLGGCSEVCVFRGNLLGKFETTNGRAIWWKWKHNKKVLLGVWCLTNHWTPVTSKPLTDSFRPKNNMIEEFQQFLLWAWWSAKWSLWFWKAILWGYPPPTNSEIICSFLWRAPYKPSLSSVSAPGIPPSYTSDISEWIACMALITPVPGQMAFFLAEPVNTLLPTKSTAWISKSTNFANENQSFEPNLHFVSVQSVTPPKG